MSRYYIILSLFLFVPAYLWAQTYSISGTVSDDEGGAVPFAAIAVFEPGDSIPSGGTTSDESGKFDISVSPGNYRIEISFLSFKSRIINDIKVINGNVNLGNIKMESNAQALDEITVTAEKSQMELKLDKRVFNVGKDITNTGSNASEVLDNIPSVDVDVEGNVSLRGSQNVRILIDGKPSGLVGMSTTDALRQLQGSLIERVEVITNPSARYDAEGEVGIINIVLKKEQQKGVNGTFEINTGYPDNHGASYNLNFRRKKVNLFSGVGVNYRKSPGKGNSYQEFYGTDTLSILESNNERARGGISSNFRLGAEYFLNDFNSVSVSGLYQNSRGNNESSINYRYQNENRELTELVERDEEELEKEETIEGNVNYRRTFKQKDRLWAVDLKWIRDNDAETADLEEFSSNTNKKPVFQRTENTENEENALVQTDYIHPFGKDGKIEGGAKSTMRIIDNDFLLEQRASDGTFQPVSAFDNHFIYNENIHAAYIMAGNKKGDFSYQFGLRWEYSDISTELTETNEKNQYYYHNLFPSAHLSYELEKKNSIQLSYSRRISRPHFRHLLPFYGFSDSRNFYSGNPNLKPEFSNSVETGHLKYWEKGSLLSSVYYRYRTGVIERVSVSDSIGTTRRFPVNLSTQHAFGIEFNISLNLKKWWRMNTSLNFYRAITDGEYQGTKLHSDALTMNGKANSRFTVTKGTDLQLSFDYDAPRVTTQGRQLAMYSMNGGMSREILKGKGTISFTVNDIFNSRKRRDVTDVSDFYSRSEFQWRARQFRLSFNYRLNQIKRKGNNDSQNGYGGDYGDDM